VKTRTPAIEGWFRLDDADPRLLATRCKSCATYFFPKETTFCRNPDCDGRELEEVALSSHGRLWSWATNYYPPPAPYVAADPFVPYTVAAVELEDEKLVVLGQVAPGVSPDELRTGMHMRLTLGPLFEDDEREYIVWKWDRA